MAIAAPGTSLAIDEVQLATVVRAVLGAPEAVVEDGWRGRPLSGGFGEGLGIWRLDGSARVGSVRRAWSVVLKSLPGGGGASTWDDLCREAHVYRSGLLASLPGGLVAPRCYAVEDRSDGAVWLWLEAVAEDPALWPESCYVRAAECLGRFNGAYLAGAPLPDAPWLSHDWLRRYVEASGPAIAELPRLAGDDANLVAQQLFTPWRIADLLRLWDERDRFFTALDRVPQTFCHHDAFRGNMLGRPDEAGRQWPVLTDWAFAGVGAVGEELVPLVLMAFLHEDRVGLRRLDAACFAAYLRGLRTAGWEGDANLVRLGFTAAAALRYTVGPLRLTMPMIADPAMHPHIEESFGRSIADFVATTKEFWAFEEELAAEARTLLPLVA